MAITKNKNPKQLREIKSALQFASEKFSSSRASGDTSLSAFKSSIKEYSEKAKAASVLENKRIGSVGDFFKGAGFDNLGELLGTLFDRAATKEEIEAAKKSLGVVDDEVKKDKQDTKKDKEKSYSLKQTQQILKKIDALGRSVVSLNQKLDYIAERVSPKIINAKEEGGESISVIQYDPLAPSGQQFRGLTNTGKLTARKVSDKYMKSATMKASLLGRMPTERSDVNRFVDPKEKSFTEEFKKDPILLLKDDMNVNFQKVFDLLEQQKEAIQSCGGGGMFDSMGVGGFGGRAGGAGRKPSRNKPKGSARTPKTTPKGSPKAPRKPKTPKPGGKIPAGGASSSRWKLFLNFVKRKSPALFARVGARLAAAAGMATVPLAGWVGAAVTLGLSLPMAWELYSLWDEFSQTSDIETSFQENDQMMGLQEDEQEQITEYLQENSLSGNFTENPERLTLIKDGDKNVGFSYYPGPIVPFEGKEEEFQRIKNKAGGDVNKIDNKYKNKPFEAKAKTTQQIIDNKPQQPKEEKGFISTSVSAVKSFFGFGGSNEEESIPKPKGNIDILNGGSVSIPSSEDDIKKMIIEHEGVRYRPYKDSRGLWTVGVGHLIGNGTTLPSSWDRQFTESEVLGLFEKDYEEHRKAAENIPGFGKMNIAGKAALTDLTFNMGPHWIKKWPNTAKKLAEGNYEGVAKDLENSKWYTQVGNRAPKIVSMMRLAGSDRIASNEKRGGLIPSQSGSESNMGMVIPSQTAAVSPVQSISGAEIDNGSKALDVAKTESSAPVIVNNTTVQQGKSSMPPPAGGQLPPAKTRSAEGSFGRAIAKDFSHPTAFTTVGTV